MNYSGVLRVLGTLSFIAACIAANPSTAGSAFNEPWSKPDRAIVLDGYEHNILDFEQIASDQRITAFIHKASDGLPAAYRCNGEDTERQLCRHTWQRYAVAKELFQTRRTLAKALGLKWGAYHLARPGDPIEQAQHFLDYADPRPDELLAIDIEGLDADKWMSLSDAATFVTYIHDKLGRWPILYANDTVAKEIADHSFRYPILSRLPLWYARYKGDIDGTFPKGNWDSYNLWQFAYQGNCPDDDSCPYRPAGTGLDIDVNVADMTPDQLRAAWPMGKLLENKAVPNVPLPIARPDIPDETMVASALPGDANIGTLEAHVLYGIGQATMTAEADSDEPVKTAKAGAKTDRPVKTAAAEPAKPEKKVSQKADKASGHKAAKQEIPALLAFNDDPGIDMTITSAYQTVEMPRHRADRPEKAKVLPAKGDAFNVDDLPPPNPARFK